jgi:Antibiotic biosynthesis monooxygenase
MRYLYLAIHYPKPEHIDDLLGAMKRLGEALHTVPGLLEATAWKDSVSGRIVAISTWESQQAFLNARPVIGETIKDVPFDEWEASPRELFNLDEVV